MFVSEWSVNFCTYYALRPVCADYDAILREYDNKSRVEVILPVGTTHECFHTGTKYRCALSISRPPWRIVKPFSDGREEKLVSPGFSMLS